MFANQPKPYRYQFNSHQRLNDTLLRASVKSTHNSPVKKLAEEKRFKSLSRISDAKDTQPLIKFRTKSPIKCYQKKSFIISKRSTDEFMHEIESFDSKILKFELPKR